MSDKICPNCNVKVDNDSKFCKNCGFSFDRNNAINDDIKKDFINLKEDIISKIQNKIDNEDILKTNDIKEMIKNLDENSLNELLDKHGISPSKLKLINFNKLFTNVDINKLKEDLIDLGIITPKSRYNDNTVRAEVIIDDEDNENYEENDVPVIDNEKDNEELNEKVQNNKTSESTKEEYSSPNNNVCSKCGFENRSKVKFCTNCGNKL